MPSQSQEDSVRGRSLFVNERRAASRKPTLECRLFTHFPERIRIRASASFDLVSVHQQQEWNWLQVDNSVGVQLALAGKCDKSDLRHWSYALRGEVTISTASAAIPRAHADLPLQMVFQRLHCIVAQLDAMLRPERTGQVLAAMQTADSRLQTAICSCSTVCSPCFTLRDPQYHMIPGEPHPIKARDTLRSATAR
jgi:hypothetical protein